MKKFAHTALALALLSLLTLPLAGCPKKDKMMGDSSMKKEDSMMTKNDGMMKKDDGMMKKEDGMMKKDDGMMKKN